MDNISEEFNKKLQIAFEELETEQGIFTIILFRLCNTQITLKTR